MTLNEYLKPPRTQTELAERLGVHQTLVGAWLRGEKRVTAERAIDIEKATNREVTREELRPDIFGKDAA